MALNTLLGEVNEEQSKKLPSRLRNPERLQQSIDAFALRLQGVSFRGIQDHFGWKSLSTAQNAVRNGEKICKELDLDTDKIRLKLAAAFDYLADVVVQQVKDQVENGREIFEVDARGNKSMKRMKGVDPRMLGEAGRGLIRFAEFAGLMDRAPEQHNTAVTMVQLAAPSDGASFSDKWASAPVEGQTVDVSATDAGATGAPGAEQQQLPEAKTE
nr:hypothetical protein 1 [bacterium]